MHVPPYTTATHVLSSHPALGQHPSQVLEDGRARGCVGGRVPRIVSPHSALRLTHALGGCVHARIYMIPIITRSRLLPRMYVHDAAHPGGP